MLRSLFGLTGAFSAIAHPETCVARSIKRYYSSAGPKRRDWVSTAYPSPISLVQDQNASEPQQAHALDSTEEIPRPVRRRANPNTKTPEEVSKHRAKIKELYPEGWAPARKLSREAMDGLRALHQYDPESFSTPVLASKFHISPEAVRRILKSRWEPPRDQRIKLAERERRSKEEWIMKKRIEERKQSLELMITAQKKEAVANPPPARERRPRGIDAKDRLSLG